MLLYAQLHVEMASLSKTRRRGGELLFTHHEERDQDPVTMTTEADAMMEDASAAVETGKGKGKAKASDQTQDEQADLLPW